MDYHTPIKSSLLNFNIKKEKYSYYLTVVASLYVNSTQASHLGRENLSVAISGAPNGN